MSATDQFIKQGGDLLQLFENALAYTVALSALQKIADDSSEYFLLSVSVALVVFILALGRSAVTSIVEQQVSNGADRGLTHGIFLCAKFLITLACSIFTQFLSTIVARYVIQFVPTLDNPIINVVPTLVITLSLLWILLFSIGIK